MASWVGFQGTGETRKSVVPACKVGFISVAPVWTIREVAGERRAGYLKVIGVVLDGLDIAIACPLADVRILHTPQEIYGYLHETREYGENDFLPKPWPEMPEGIPSLG